MRKSKKSKILSLILCMSMILSTFAFTSGMAAAEEVKSLNDMTVEEQFEYLKSLDSEDEVEKAVKSLSDEEYKELESYINEKAKEEAEKNPPKTVTFTKAGPFLPAVNVAEQTVKRAKRVKATNAGAINNGSDDGLNLSKKVTKNEDGTYKISLEAYTTGKVTTTTKTIPVDIVLVLDQSGSMAYDFDGNSTSDNTKRRQYAMKQAVNNFINEVNKKYSEEADHRISVVTFGSGAKTLQGWTSVDSEGKTSLGKSINELPQSPSGATNVGAGMQRAETLMGNEYNYTGSNTERQKVVIVFTDGVPTTQSDFDTGVANTAISSAKNLKDGGCTVYSIGIFNGANPEELYGASGFDTNSDGTVNSGWIKDTWGLFPGTDFPEADRPAGNRFLNYLSSNSPEAEKIGLKRETAGVGIFHYKVTYKITENYVCENNGYYLTAQDSTGLNNIFKTISEQIQTSDIDLGSETVIKDIVADQFTMPKGVDKVKVESVECTGYNNDEPQWGKSTAVTDGISIDKENKTVNVIGFDFNNNFVSKNEKPDGTHGAKLVIEFNVSVKDDFLGGNDVRTNGINSGVYEKKDSQDPVKRFEQPSVKIPTKEITPKTNDQNIYITNKAELKGLLNGTDERINGTNNAYVDITYTIKDGDKVIGTLEIPKGTNTNEGSGWTPVWKWSEGVDGTPALENDKAYTITCEVNGGADNISDTKNPPTAKVNVFEPELAYKDSTVYYGDTAPTNYDGNKTGDTAWKHGDTVDTSVTMTGSKPELTLSYDPAIGDKTYFNNSKISTKTDIPVKVTARIGEKDVTNHVNFVHGECSPSCGFDSDKEQFLIHVKTCSLTVTKNGGVDDEPYVMNIYKDDKPYTSMTITGNNSETVKELPVGTYTVQEDTDWAWRYKDPAPTVSAGVMLSGKNDTGTITVNNRNRYNSFLNGYSTVVKNVFGNII
ncbi:MAG: vWA domain-containing protein [Anaerovoracaceae bacterium]